MAKYKLCKVKKIFVGTKGILHLVTHDACTSITPNPSSRWIAPFKLTWRLARLLISSSLTLVTCAWWLAVLTWEELVWLPTGRDIRFFWCTSYERCKRQQLCHMALEQFHYRQRQQTVALSSLWKVHSPYHCWGETGDWQPNRAVDKMISMWCDWKSLCT